MKIFNTEFTATQLLMGIVLISVLLDTVGYYVCLFAGIDAQAYGVLQKLEVLFKVMPVE